MDEFLDLIKDLAEEEKEYKIFHSSHSLAHMQPTYCVFNQIVPYFRKKKEKIK